MSRCWVALLYSIVLGQGRRLVMADLRDLAAELGFGWPRTLLATGNLIFEAEGDTAELEGRLEAAFAARFGKHIDIILREGARWPQLMAGNPFPEASEREPARVAVRVMRTPLDAGVIGVLDPYRAGGERLEVVDGDLWVHMPDGIGTSRLARAITPARAGGAGTFRNWNTVRKIGAALDGGPR
jgi:uncharacterized protein (DUF1697 family)